MLKWIKKRVTVKFLKQASTGKGLVAVLGAVGITMSPEASEYVLGAAVSMIGLIECFRDEDPEK